MASPPPPPNLKSCPKCGHSNLAENVYCGKCGGAVQPGVTGPAAAGGAAVFPRSLVILSAARLAISAIMLAILLFFFIMFMALVGNLGNLGGGGGGHQCPSGEKWDDAQQKCVPDGGGGQVNVQGVDVDTGGTSWMVIQSANCQPCQASPGTTLTVKVMIQNTDSTDHQVNQFTANTAGFSLQNSAPSTPYTISAGSTFEFSLDFKTPNRDWSGRLQVNVQGN